MLIQQLQNVEPAFRKFRNNILKMLPHLLRRRRPAVRATVAEQEAAQEGLDFVFYSWAGPVRIARSANSQTTRILAKCDCLKAMTKKKGWQEGCRRKY